MTEMLRVSIIAVALVGLHACGDSNPTREKLKLNLEEKGHQSPH